MIQLFLVRHGDCEGSGTYIGRGSDVPLTDTGIKEMQALGKIFRDSLNLSNVDFLYSSSMLRARQSADILTSFLNSPVRELAGMEESDFGEWEGLSYREIEEKNPLDFQKWLNNPLKISPPGGESLMDLKKRVIENCSSFLQKSVDEKTWKIVIVSHKGPLTVLLTELLKIETAYFWNFRIDRGSVAKLNIYPRFCEIEFLNRKN